MANPGVTYEQWQEAVAAYDEHDGYAAAARALSIPEGTLTNRVKAGTVKYGETSGKKFGGATTLRKYEYGESGDVVLEWSRTDPKFKDILDGIREAAEGLASKIPKSKPPKAPNKPDTDVIPWFQIGDAHLGMLAHESEVGTNFDLKIAERELCAAFSILFDECQPHERCVINDLGDFTHYENMRAETEASGHKMDADGRFPKMIKVYARIMQFVVDRALEKFRHVDVIINQGNHSRTNDIWMAVMLDAVYGSTGRVHVLDNSGVHIPYRMGNTFCMTHHGDKTKPIRLTDVMANDFRQDWGEAEYRYIDVGHLHHKAVDEKAGVIIEQWNTLAPRDKYGNDGGWRSHQSITRVDRSKTHGEVGRRRLPIGEVRAAILKAHGDHYCPPKRREVHTV